MLTYPYYQQPHQRVPFNNTQYVPILDPDTDEVLGLLVKDRRDDSKWIEYQYDMSDYAGETIKLYFGVHNNGSGGVTGMLWMMCR